MKTRKSQHKKPDKNLDETKKPFFQKKEAQVFPTSTAFFLSPKRSTDQNNQTTIIPNLQKDENTASGTTIPSTPTKPSVFMVKSSKALLRTPPPELKPNRDQVDQYADVIIINSATKGSGRKQKEYVEIKEATPSTGGKNFVIGWTAKSNLVELHKPTKYRLGSKARKMARRVLKKAGQDPDAWFQNFQYTSFLGRMTKTPLHTTLVQHLKGVEKTLTAKFSNGTNDPAVAGNNLGLDPQRETIKGARTHSTGASKSMHFFGLAIDLDYSKNPHIRDKSSDKRATRKAFHNAGKLINGAPAVFDSDASKMNAQNVEDLLNKNELLKTYFSFLDKANLAALQQKLDEAKTNKISPWRHYSPSKARKIIRADLRRAARAWSRRSSKLKETGYTNFSKDLIMGMDLHWGGTYGDMMHFDMRNKGTGKTIDDCRMRRDSCPDLD